MDAIDLQALGALFARIPAWFGFVWIGTVVMASLLWRTTRGKPIFAGVPRQALFLERWRSGRQTSSVLGRLGGASNCLMVAVGDGRVRIAPQFPFSLMFLPELFGLEVDVPVSKVRAARIRKGWFLSSVLLEVEDRGEVRAFELQVSDAQSLLAAVRPPAQSETP